jgi:LPXTG-motif cell wall-anchored protein
MAKMKIFGFLLFGLIALSLISSLVVAQTLVTGAVYDKSNLPNGVLESVSVEVSCKSDSMTVESDSEGIYKAYMNHSSCDVGDNVIVKFSLSGFNPLSEEGVVKLCGSDGNPCEVGLSGISVINAFMSKTVVTPQGGGGGGGSPRKNNTVILPPVNLTVSNVIVNETAENETLEEEIVPEETPAGRPGITGAFIGALGPVGSWVVVAFIVAILGGAGWLAWKRRKSA